MFSAFERMIALRYLRPRKKEGIVFVIASFSTLGIMIGVAALIVVMSVMNGFRIELLGRIIGIQSHISIYNYGEPISDYNTLAEKIRNIEGVKNVAPVINGQVLAVANNSHVGAEIRSISKSDLQNKETISGHIKTGTLEDFGGTNVIIGSRMAANLGLVPGDIIRLISPQTTDTFIGAMPRLKDYKIVGIFDVGMIEYDSSTIFMPLEAGQIYFKMPGKVGAIEIYVNEPNNLQPVYEAIDKALGGSLQLVDWQKEHSHFIEALITERNVMFMILCLIFLVVSFNIVSGLVILVNNKKKEVAILRTMGATKGSIMRIFFMCGTFIGIVGTGLGVMLGVWFAKNIQTIREWLERLTGADLFNATIYYLSKLPSDIRPGNIILIASVSLTFSLLATLYPAWKAARINPAEGVRYE